MNFTEAGIEIDTRPVPESDSNVTDLSGSHFVSFPTNCQIRTFWMVHYSCHGSRFSETTMYVFRYARNGSQKVTLSEKVDVKKYSVPKKTIAKSLCNGKIHSQRESVHETAFLEQTLAS
jgi:hypothetical protein